MKRCAVFLVCLILVSTSVGAQKASTSDERLKAVEDALRSLTSQIADLNSKFRPPPSQPTSPVETIPPPVETIQPTSVSLNGVPRKGAPAAKIVLIEFSDFECPYCGQHAQGPYAQIQQEYVSNGKIQYAFRHFPLEQLHPGAKQAAEAAACANDQGKFWEFHDKLFVNQRALQLPNLQEYAKSAQVDGSKFDACMTSHQMAGRVSDDLAEARRLGLSATPAFVIGELQPNQTVRVTRRIVGAHPMEVFQLALNEQLQAK
jgi:protein-disulfide isomerase